MDQKLLSFVIKTLLLKPHPQGYFVPQSTTQYPMVAEEPCVLDEETITAMRDLIADRVARHSSTIADALMERITTNVQMQNTSNIVFELCDAIVSPYTDIVTNKVTKVDPRLSGALIAILSACNYPFTPPQMGVPKEGLIHAANQLGGYVTGMQRGIEVLVQNILSEEVYSPFTVLRNTKSKVVILHNGPDKAALRSIADEKKMIILTDSAKGIGAESHSRPEVVLLLMLNAYYSQSISKDQIFPKEDRDYLDRGHLKHSWATDTVYLAVEDYINNTVEDFGNFSYSIREELKRKAPEFLKDFDEDLTVIRNQYNRR